MYRVVFLVLALVFALAGSLATGLGPVVAQTSPSALAEARDERAVADAARELSRLEAARDFDGLYERIHPDAAAVVPRAAVVGWYQEAFADKETDELTVTGVEFVAWSWGVTGKTYPRAASVSFVQPYEQDGVRTEEPGVVHLVEEDGEWGWFFGDDRAFVDAQIARFAPVAEPVVPDEPAVAVGGPFGLLDEDVNRFWAEAFAAAGRVYDPPDGVVGFDEPIGTDCGLARPEEHAAFYCTLDQTIYYVADFRNLVEGEVGDFGWETVVAHEWGHHVQAQLGVYASERPELDEGLYTIDLELQADCLAGAYTQDAEARNWLDPGDIEEALRLTAAAGDPSGTAWDDPQAHGTSEQRLDAFERGYQDGLGACGLPL